MFMVTQGQTAAAIMMHVLTCKYNPSTKRGLEALKIVILLDRCKYLTTFMFVKLTTKQPKENDRTDHNLILDLYIQTSFARTRITRMPPFARTHRPVSAKFLFSIFLFS
jgi:hypothetical protein